MKKNLIIAGVFVVMFVAGNGYAGVSGGNDDLLEILVEKGVVTEQEALELKGSGKGKLEISSEIFLNFTHYEHYWEPSLGGPTLIEHSGLNVERAYLTADYDFDRTWMMRLTTDINVVYNAVTKTNDYEVFLKNALVSGRFSPELTVEIGIIDTPWVVYEESLWAHRYVARVMSDNLRNSSDGGIGVRGNLVNSLVQYHVAAVNGGGYKNISTSSTTLDFDSRLGLYPIKGLTVDFQFRTGFGGSRSVSYNGTYTDFYQGMITYGLDNFRVGANYYEREAENRSTPRTTEYEGYALWGWVDVTGEIGVFGRYEYKKSHVPSDAPPAYLPVEEDHYIVGVEYQANDKISIALAWDYSDTENVSYLTGISQKQERYGLYVEAGF